MKKLLVTLVLVLLPACSIIKPSDANLIDQHAGNAKAINAKVQADPVMPDYAKRWWAAEAETWRYMSDWAHHRAPAPTSQPVK